MARNCKKLASSATIRYLGQCITRGQQVALGESTACSSDALGSRERGPVQSQQSHCRGIPRANKSLPGWPSSSFVIGPLSRSTFGRWDSKYLGINLRDISSDAAAAVSDHGDDELETVAGFEWDNLGFGLYPTDAMFTMKCEKGGSWVNGEVQPFGNMELSPASSVLNYGQGLFEGLKAYRTFDGRVLLFRPEQNALRMIDGADRLCMPAPPVNLFVDAVKQTVLANKRWIPPAGRGALYIRPLLIGSGAMLGLAVSPEFKFIVYVSPVGNYFKAGLAPLNLKVDTYYHRAAPGGTGGVKTIGNYAPGLKAQLHAKDNGYSDVLYLDAVENKYVEEVSACNIFIVKGKTISTPELRGTILPGITRRSIIELARLLEFEVQERPVSVEELLDADEAFCTGTAVVVNPVGSVTYQDRSVKYENAGEGGVGQRLYTALTEIQTGKAEDKLHWTVEL